MYIRISQVSLYHYGVKGMKWGVRKAQRRLGKYDLDSRRRREKRRFSHDSVDSIEREAAKYANNKQKRKDYRNAHYHQHGNDFLNYKMEYLDKHRDKYRDAVLTDIKLDKYKNDKQVQALVDDYVDQKIARLRTPKQ